MIFGESTLGYSSPVKPSRYEVGLEGALMHVAENEQNYNALMKAACLSELKYYNETGKELFLTEAGAFDSFIRRAKEFFKKVIEKIKAIFHRFAATINRLILPNKDFVKKYENEILRKASTVKDFEVDGYRYTKLDEYIAWLGSNALVNLFKDGTADIKRMGGEYEDMKDDADKDKIDTWTYTADELADKKEEIYAGIAKGDGGSTDKMSESEMREEILDRCRGDKDSFMPNFRNYLSTIKEADKTIKAAGKARDTIIKAIDDYIKALDAIPAKINRAHPAASETDDDSKKRSAYIKYSGQLVDLGKALSNAMTVAYGTAIGLMKNRVTEYKAACVKLIAYNANKESYAYGYGSDDIFAGVNII